MAASMQTGRHFEPSDGKVHREDELPAVKAKQGRSGRRVLTVLLAALILAFIVWIPVEIWGGHKAEEAAPQKPAETQAAPAITPKSAQETPADVDAQHR